MGFNYKGFTIKPFKNHYIVIDSNGKEWGHYDTEKDAIYYINRFLDLGIEE